MRLFTRDMKIVEGIASCQINRWVGRDPGGLIDSLTPPAIYPSKLAHQRVLILLDLIVPSPLKTAHHQHVLSI
jgi:hypothetical protein